MTEKGYNGWANYPTWNIALWINNEQGWQESTLERAGECFSQSRFELSYPGQSRKEVAAAALGESLQEELEELSGELGATGPLADIMGWALGCVDWYELGESFVNDYLESLRYEHCS